MENKYLKYKYKYLNKKGGAEYYVNPLKMDEYILRGSTARPQ